MTAMPKDLFCLPTAKKVVPAGSDWIKNRKHPAFTRAADQLG
jgi:hypothetical protein